MLEQKNKNNQFSRNDTKIESGRDKVGVDKEINLKNINYSTEEELKKEIFDLYASKINANRQQFQNVEDEDIFNKLATITKKKIEEFKKNIKEQLLTLSGDQELIDRLIDWRMSIGGEKEEVEEKKNFFIGDSAVANMPLNFSLVLEENADGKKEIVLKSRDFINHEMEVALEKLNDSEQKIDNAILGSLKEEFLNLLDTVEKEEPEVSTDLNKNIEEESVNPIEFSKNNTEINQKKENILETDWFLKSNTDINKNIIEENAKMFFKALEKHYGQLSFATRRWLSIAQKVVGGPNDVESIKNYFQRLLDSNEDILQEIDNPKYENIARTWGEIIPIFNNISLETPYRKINRYKEKEEGIKINTEENTVNLENYDKNMLSLPATEMLRRIAIKQDLLGPNAFLWLDAAKKINEVARENETFEEYLKRAKKELDDKYNSDSQEILKEKGIFNSKLQNIKTFLDDVKAIFPVIGVEKPYKKSYDARPQYQEPVRLS